MPNYFAYIVLFSWPVVVYALFQKLPQPAALIWSILGGYLFLPYAVGYDPPLLPVLDKTLIPAMSAAVICLLMPKHPGPLRRMPLLDLHAATPSPAPPYAPSEHNPSYTRQRVRLSKRPNATVVAKAEASVAEPSRLGIWVMNLLIMLILTTPFLTVLQNSAPVIVGQRVLPGLRLYDSFSMILGELVALLPFVLGRRYLAKPDQQVTLLRILCIAGLLYTLPILFELRMSPQLSRWVYGFMARPFGMTIREGGYRPVVFLQAGLWLAIFMVMTTISAIAAWRYENARRVANRWGLAGLYLAAILVFCHSLGALMIFLILVPVLLLTSVRWQLITATVVALAILTYPTLRGTGIVPVDTIYDFVKSSISEARAQSFQFRLQNEDRLLARARERPIAGWGGWARGRVYDENGKDISVTDGIWVIILGMSGWLGYIGKFGLLTAPILLLTLQQRRLELSLATSGLALALVANLIDMIPNATLTPVTWLIAGALAGRATLSAANTIPAKFWKDGAPHPARDRGGAAHARSSSR